MSDLPEGFTLDAAPSGSADLPAGFQADPSELPSGFTPDQPSTVSDVGRSLGTGLIKGGANFAAAATAPEIVGPAMAVKYGVPALETGANYAAQDITNLARMGAGKAPISEQQWNQNDQDFAKQHPVLSALDPATLASKIPSAADITDWAAKTLGHPLYQPQTPEGRVAEQIPEYAGMGGAKALQALPSAIGFSAAPEAVKAAGGNQQLQFLSGLGAGVGAGKVAGLSAPEAPNTEGKFTPPEPPPAPVSAQDLRDRAKPYYDYSKSQGVDFTPETQASIPDAINSALSKTGKMNASLHSDTLSVLGDLQNEADAGTLDMESLHQYRQLFGDVINSNLHPNGKMMPDAMKANSAIDAIDNVLEQAKADPSMLSKGSPDAIDAWQKGQQLWAASARASDIERIMQRAEFMQNPATSMRQGFASLAGNPARISRFTPEQQGMIQDAADSNLGIETMRAIGSRLIPYALLGAHNPLAAIAAIPISAVGRSLAGGMQAVKGQKIINNIAGNAPSEFVQPQAKATPLQLPAPAINVPEGGFGTTPPSDPTPDVNYNSGQRALPAPQEMTYEDMAKNGRILQSPQNTPINMPEGAVTRTYNPNDLNRGDEGGYPPTIEAIRKYLTAKGLPKDAIEAKLQQLVFEFGSQNAASNLATRTSHASGGRIVHAGENKRISGLRGTESEKNRGLRSSTGAKRVSEDDEKPTVIAWARMLHKARKHGMSMSAKDRSDPTKVEKLQKAIS